MMHCFMVRALSIEFFGIPQLIFVFVVILVAMAYLLFRKENEE